MKKILVSTSLCLLMILVPVASALPVLNQQEHHLPITTRTSSASPLDSPPEWAEGNFSGVWGLNILGQPLSPIGWVAGYYDVNGIIGRFEGIFDQFNVTNATGAIGGFFLGPFMFGKIMNITTGNATGFVGLGGANETHFYWRIMGIIGPTFYMYGVYSKFENSTAKQQFMKID